MRGLPEASSARARPLGGRKRAPWWAYSERAGALSNRYSLSSAATPTQAHVEKPWTWALSSAWWKSGWFYDDWTKGTGGWTRILVRCKWDLKDGQVVPYLPEREFKAKWAAKGVRAYYSDFPTKESLELEMRRHPETTIRQQYFCEFQDVSGSVFNDDWISGTFTRDVKPLFNRKGGLDPEVKALGVLKKIK